MDFKTFLENFDAIAEAPGGIPKLRSLILDLAVRGKLVPQNPEDEPAEKLMQHIYRQRDELIKAQVIRSRKAQSINQVDEPYELPISWKWTRLCEIAHDLGQKKPDVRFSYIDVSSIDKEKGSVSSEVSVLKPENAPSRARKLVQKGTVIYSTVRPYLLNIAVIDKEYEPEPIVSTAFSILHPYEGIYNQYLYYLLRSQYFTEYVEQYQKGVAYPAISDGDLLQAPVPLPPSNEQKRIVAKVHELMALCDRYEAAKQTRDNLRQKLRESAIASLMNAETDEELDAAWAFVRDNWHNLSQHPEDVSSLRKTILELAVRGKLVPQDSEDCEAKYEIEEIVKRTKELESSGQLSKQKKPLPLSNQLPYSIPQTWSWARFVKVASIESNLVKPDDFLDSPHIAPNYIEKGTGRLLSYQTVAADNVTSPKHLFYPGQIVYSKIRPNLNKVTIVDFEGLCSADMYPISTGLYPRYLLLFMLSQPFVNQVTSGDNRLAMPKVNQEQLSQVLVAVPPLAEQKRIVARVNELMKLCDQLEASLHQSQQRAESLAASAISHLTI